MGGFHFYIKHLTGYQLTSFLKRIPIRENNDTRYFSDKYQGIPKIGFTQLLKNICDDIQIKIKQDRLRFLI
jgi:UDP-galactopyranose mutase